MSSHRYSGIETAYRCLRKYKLDYIDKLPQEGPASIELGFGTGIHSAIQASLEGDDAQGCFKLYWGSLKPDFKHEEFRYKDYYFKGLEFLRKFDKLHKPHLTPQHLEVTLKGNIQGYEFEGTPDFVGLYKGVPSIIDWKTSQNAYLREKLLTNPQLPLYAELAKQVHGFEAKQIVYMVFVKSSTSTQVIVEPLTKSLLTQALGSVINMTRVLESEKSYPQNFTACIMGSRVCNRYKNCYGVNK